MRMNQFKILMCLILVLCLNIEIYSPEVYAAEGNPTGILDVDEELGTGFQALKFTVNSVSSTSGSQAFVIGWNVRILNSNGTTFATVYVSTPPVFDGSTRTYYLPLSDGYSRTGDTVSSSVESKIRTTNPNLTAGYKAIIEQDVGSTFLVDAHIQKYTYSSSRIPQYQPVSPYIYADNMIEINDNFSEFSSAFKDNLPGVYFDLSRKLKPEPKPFTNTVKIQYWENTEIGTIRRSDISQGDIVITSYNSTTSMFTPTANIPSDYTIVGNRLQYVSDMPTSAWTDYSTWNKTLYFPLAVPNVVGYLNILIEKTLPPEPDTGTIYIKCLDYSTNSVISSSSIPNVSYGTAKIVSSPLVDGYGVKGSYLSSGSSTPSTSSMQLGIKSQSVILSSTNKDAYVYFWYDKNAEIKGPVAFIDGPTKVRAGDDFELSGSRSYCKQAGAKIVNYKWNVDIIGVSGETHLGSPGTHTIELTVTDSNGLTASTTHDIEVTPPTPTASFSLAGKIKENRKITVDAHASDTPDNYGIVWSKTTWHIEPDLTTGATWEIGVRLLDGTVKKIDQNTDQSFLNGADTFYFQARYAGNYKVKLYVENSYPANDTCNGLIVVAKDLAPISEVDMQSTNLREYTNPIDNTKQNYGIIPIVDHSYSSDGDIIGKRTWCYRYNSQNNKDINGEPIFSDDVTMYKYLGNLGTTFDISERQRLVVNNDNDINVEIMSYDVGKYEVQVITEESITDDETIKELLLPTDIRISTLKGW